MQPSGQLPPPTSEDIYCDYDHFIDSTRFTVDFDGSLNDQYAALHTTPPQPWQPSQAADHDSAMTPPPFKIELGQLTGLPNNDSQNQLRLSDHGPRDIPYDHSTGMQMRPSSSVLSISPPALPPPPPPPPPPHDDDDIRVMPPTLQPHPHHQRHVMAPASDGAVHNQSDLEAERVNSQMEDLIASLEEAVAADPDIAAASGYHHSSGPPGQFYNLPVHLGSLFQEHSQPSRLLGENILLPPGDEEHVRREEIFSVEDTVTSGQGSSQRGAKQRAGTKFHPYQWPPPKRSRSTRRKAKGSGSQSKVSGSLPSMAAPPQPMITSTTSTTPSVPSPDPDPSELLYNPKNRRHTRIFNSASAKVYDYAVNTLSCSTGDDREEFVQWQLGESAVKEYCQEAFGKKWAATNWKTLYMTLSEPCRSIMNSCKRHARSGVQCGFKLRPPPRSRCPEPDHQKATATTLLDDKTFPPKYTLGKDENGDEHFLENDVVWDVLLNTVAELRLYDYIKNLRSLFCTAAAAVKCALQELVSGRFVEILFSGTVFKPVHISLEDHIDNKITPHPVLSKRWKEYNDLTWCRLRQVCRVEEVSNV